MVVGPIHVIRWPGLRAMQCFWQRSEAQHAPAISLACLILAVRIATITCIISIFGRLITRSRDRVASYSLRFKLYNALLFLNIKFAMHLDKNYI